MTESEATKLTYRGRENKAYCDHSVREIIMRLADYEDIGTVSEFRELKEKATAKQVAFTKDKRFALCPCCQMILDGGEKYCDCGQKLLWDWSEGKE